MYIYYNIYINKLSFENTIKNSSMTNNFFFTEIYNLFYILSLQFLLENISVFIYILNLLYYKIYN